MRIYNKKSFIISVIWLLIALLGVVALAIKEADMRLIILTPILFVLGCATMFFSLSKRISKHELRIPDERDKLIIMKCGYAAIKIFCTVCFIVIFVLMVVFALSKITYILSAIITLTATMVFLCILMLLLNIYYESRN